ncbi:MAG: glycosyl hydrolase family 43 [Kiritimatiellaceae bacterium]|nr:glycosyl hydrolase family 43 [Kiritimatiellaceae bacterium]
MQETCEEVVFSEFCKKIQPCGRILEQDGWNVWCCSPIYGEDGRVHVFYSRWRNDFNFWVADCEIGHAVADRPEGPYTHVDTALSGRGGTAWDSWSVHNPTIHKVGDRYALLYMGSDGSGLDITKEDLPGMDWDTYQPYFMRLVESKRIGLAVSDSLDGPWTRISDEKPLLEPSPETAWDDMLTTNPALLQLPDGTFRLYYKSIDWKSWREIFGIRRFGTASAKRLEGPYVKYKGNPVLTFEHLKPRFIANGTVAVSKEKEYEFETAQVEDAYVWQENGTFRMICRDMGFFNHEYGLYLESDDGLNWTGAPQVAYRDAAFYFDEKMPGLAREGRFERPQVLMKDGRPAYLFCAWRGGKYRTSSGVVLKIK